jgi:hypothetical protein
VERRFVEKRVETLERTVEGLSALPSRVEAVEGQMLQLRSEMRSEFSAIRDEFVQVRAEIKAGDEETRTQMRILHEAALARIAMVAEGVGGTRDQLGALRADTERFQHDVTARLSAIAAQLTRRGRRSR